MVCPVAGDDRGRRGLRTRGDGAQDPRTLCIPCAPQGPQFQSIPPRIRPGDPGGRSARFALRPHADRGDDTPPGHHRPHAGRRRGQGPRGADGGSRVGPAARARHPLIGFGYMVPERQEPFHGDGLGRVPGSAARIPRDALLGPARPCFARVGRGGARRHPHTPLQAPGTRRNRRPAKFRSLVRRLHGLCAGRRPYDPRHGPLPPDYRLRGGDARVAAAGDAPRTS